MNYAKDTRGYWYNCDKDEYEYRDAPTTAEEALSFIPAIPAARGMFAVYIRMGDAVLDAMTKTLTACVGDKKG